MIMIEFNVIKKSFADDKSLRKAVNAMCAHCMGCTAVEQGNGATDHLEQGYARLIRECSSHGCPLYRFRPFQVVRERAA